MGLTQVLTNLIEPNDQSFKDASLEDRRWFYETAGGIAKERSRIQLSRGIGANGRAMPVRKQAVLAPGVDGPVMEPHYDMSRVITLSTYRASSRSLILTWKPGLDHPDAHAARARHTRKNLKHLGGKGKGSRGGGQATAFGDILQYHADGLVRAAPVRDVRLSAASIAQVKSEMAKRWRGYIADRTPALPPAPQPQPRPPAVPITPAGVPPPKIAAVGRTDTANFTFGIGGSKELADRAIASGHFTGFRKLGPRPPTAPGVVPLPTHLPFVPPGTGGAPAPHTIPLPNVARPPTPVAHTVPMRHAPLPVHGAIAVPLRPVATTPVPVVPPPRVVGATAQRTPAGVAPTLAKVEQDTGLRFAPSEPARGKDTVVIVDTAKLDAALAADAGFHVGPGGTGSSAKPGAYANAQAFLAKAREGGTPVDMPRLGLAKDGTPTVVDGRHRLAALRDAGVRFVPVTVPKSAAARFRQLFGG